MSNTRTGRAIEVLRKQTDTIRQLRADLVANEQAAEQMVVMLLLKLGGSVTVTPEDALASLGYQLEDHYGADSSGTLRAIPKPPGPTS